MEEVEFWVSFIDRCPLLPNGGHRPFTHRLVSLLLSRVQSALKALQTHTLAFFLTLCCPLVSQILLPLRSFPLFVTVSWFTRHLHCITLRTLCEWLGQRLRYSSYWLQKILHCAFMLHSVCVSCREWSSSTTSPVVQREDVHIVMTEWDCRTGGVVSILCSHHTPPSYSTLALPYCIQVTESRLTCSLTDISLIAMSARNAHILSTSAFNEK